MLAFIKRYHRSRQRRLDRELLFPVIAEIAGGDPGSYRHALRTHMQVDPAWGVPLAEMSEVDRDIYLIAFGTELGHGTEV